MNFSFFISRRYLFSKKSHNAINIITWISIGCVAVVTFALVVILSGLNGLSDLVENLYNSFTSDIRIEPEKGKTYYVSPEKKKALLLIPGIAYCEEVLEENALVSYTDKQLIITMKGVNQTYLSNAGVVDFINEGEPILNEDTINYTIPGQGIYDRLEVNYQQDFSALEFFVPKKGASFSIDPVAGSKPFNSESAYASAVFHLNDDFDYNYAFVPLSFARRLLENDSLVSCLELGVKDGFDHSDISKKISAVMGQGFVVKDRYRQNELLFKTLQTEKLWVFIILLFILIVATFNIIGSLTMLIIEKKKDVSVLRSMGASKRTVKNIFILEGLLITTFGALLGLIFGIGACWLQVKYGLIPMEEGFVVDYYPVIVKISDMIYILTSVIVVGYIASYYPVSFFTSRSYRHLSAE